MLFSTVLIITDKGLLVYIGHKGVLHEVIGGTDGELLLRAL